MDHLEPEDSIFGDQFLLGYELTVATVLGRSLPERSLRMIAIPSFTAEFGVGLRRGETACSIVSVQAEDHIWLLESNSDSLGIEAQAADSTEGSGDVDVVRSELSIDSNRCERIFNAWTAVLLRTRYPEVASAGLDGTTYHFTTVVFGFGDLAGKTWSPTAESIPGKLVTLALQMRAYAESGSELDTTVLDTAIEELERAIQ